MIDYTVHSCETQAVSIKATLNGNEVEATVSGLVVELVTDDGSQGHTFRFTPTGDEDMAAKKALFVVGNKVRCDFTPIGAVA